MNKVILIGRTTRDIELRYITDGTAVASFTIAIDRPKKKDGSDNGADFINIISWGGQAETISKYVSKGDLIAVDGKLQTRNYENKDGKKIYVMEVIANHVKFLQKKSKNNVETTSTEETFEVPWDE